MLSSGNPEKFTTWQNRLQNAGLSKIAAIFIEAAGPLNVLAAQGLYLVDPILKSSSGNTSISDLAEILESKEDSRKFAEILRNRLKHD